MKSDGVESSVSSAERGEVPLHSALVSARAAGGQWLIEAAWRVVLLDGTPPDWFALETDSRATRVKTGRDRATWRVTIGHRQVYAKVFDDRGGPRSLLSRLTGSTAHREWKPSRRALHRGVPIAPVLALGRSADAPRRSVLIVQGIAAASTLIDAWRDEVVAETAGDRRRRTAARLIDAAARLWALAHQRGFVHGDGHPGNVLVATEPDGVVRAVFIDARQSRLFRGPVDQRRSVQSLAEAGQAFERVATRTERLRFLRQYLRRRFADGRVPRAVDRARLKEWAFLLAKSSRSHRDRLIRRRDRRLRGDGVYFARVRLRDGWRGIVCLKLARRQVFSDAKVPDRTLADWERILRNWQARPEGAAELAQSGIVVEEIERADSLLESFRWRVQGSPCRGAFLSAHRKRHSDAPGPLPVGWLERRAACGVTHCALFAAARRDDRPESDDTRPGSEGNLD